MIRNMRKKQISVMLWVAGLLTLLCGILFYMNVDIHSVETMMVYVNATSGNDANSGLSSAVPLKTIQAGIEKIGSANGKIVLTAPYRITSDFTAPRHRGTVTITTNDGKTDWGKSGAQLSFSSNVVFRLSGPMTFKDLTFVLDGTTVVAANFNSVVFDTGIVVRNSNDSSTRNLFIVGGFESPDAKSLPTYQNPSITINSGTYRAVCGFSRTKGIATMYFTGTADITVNGGDITGLYGASLYNHTGGNARITVNGGLVDQLYTGGDVTRRLTGYAEVYLNGGTVKSVNINNVTGNALLVLNGTKYETTNVFYYNDVLLGYAQTAGSVKTLRYDSRFYTVNQINKLESLFDITENITSVYVAAGGQGDGSSPDKATGSLSKAVSDLSERGGTVYITGRVLSDINGQEPAHSGEITFRGTDRDAVLAFPKDASYILSNDVTFDALSIEREGTLTFVANGKKLRFGADFRTPGGSGIFVYGTDGSADGNNVKLELLGGSFERVAASAGANLKGEANILVNGAEIETLYGGSAGQGSAEDVCVVFYGGAIKHLYSSAGEISGRYTLSVGGGTIDNVYLNNVKGAVSVYLNSGVIRALTSADSPAADKKIVYNEQSFALSLLDALPDSFEIVKEIAKVYLSDNGTGDGSSAAKAFGSLTDAVSALAKSGGTIVVSGTYTINTTLDLPAWSAPIVITSNDGFMDYRERGATVVLNANLLLGGETLLRDLTFSAKNANVTIYARCFPFTVDEGVSTVLTHGNNTHINLTGGHNTEGKPTSVNMTIRSGIWEWVRGGSDNTKLISSCSDVNLTVSGGVFRKPFVIASRGTTTNCNATLTVAGGIFYGGIFGAYEEDGASYTFDWKIKINLEGGTFYGRIAPAFSKGTTVNGSFDVYISDGDYTGLTDLQGGQDFGGNMQSTLTINESVDIEKKETGTITFTNYLIVAADPWLFYHDGFYYFTSTGGSFVRLYKVANIPDIKTATGTVIYRPAPGQMYSKNLWSPEIHYFSPEEMGENAGWYLFLGSDDGNTYNQRAYVLKCLDGDNLLGRWGHPVTGEVNVPVKVKNPDDPSMNNDVLTGGQSKIVINGKTYVMFVTEEGRGTSGFHQSLNIIEIENPWTYKGKATQICIPEHDWEKGGYGKSTTEENAWYPMVVECNTAVYGENGEVYVVYSASGYWTVHYALGQLAYTGGDPLDAANWVKKSTPILSRSDQINGTGSPSFVTDTDGNRWICYHAYTGNDTTSGRFAFVEPYKADAIGVTIGNGSGKPNDINTEYTVNVNPCPLSGKINGFGQVVHKSGDGNETGTSPGDSEGGGFKLKAIHIAFMIGFLLLAMGAAAGTIFIKKKRRK